MTTRRKKDAQHKGKGHELALSTELVAQIADLKGISQLSWEEIAVWLEKETGETWSYKTIQRHLIKAVPNWTLPAYVTKRAMEQAQEMFEQVNIGRLMATAFLIRFTEFFNLWQKKLEVNKAREIWNEATQRWEKVPKEAAQVETAAEEAVEFTKENEKRMDQLFNDISGFTFSIMSIMKDAVPGSMPDIFQSGDMTVNVKGTSVELAERIEESSKGVKDSMGKIVTRVMEDQAKEKRGVFRIIEEEENGADK